MNPLCFEVKRQFFIVALCLLGVSPGCAHGRETTQGFAAKCPPGAEDYGSGMVAVPLPSNVAAGLALVHEHLGAQLGRPTGRPYATAPFAPHVSLVYGLTAERVAEVDALMGAQFRAQAPNEVCFGELKYWDNEAQAVTSVVIDILDDSHALETLHEQLQVRLGTQARFAYRPHVTLAFAPLGARLGPTQARALLVDLTGRCWKPFEVYWTDQCGQSIGHARWCAPESIERRAAGHR